MSTIDPSSSRQATVADESEELAAEAAQQTSISASSAAVTTTTIEVNGNGSGSLENVNGQSQPEGKAPVNDEDEDEYDPNRIPDDACETLYLHNLNEKVRVPIMTQTLANLFKSYRPIMPIVAHRNLRMRGQAFVTFPDIETANRARREVGEFPLYGKPVQIGFAKTRSDSAVKRLEGEEALEAWKKTRLAEKKKHRRDNVLRRKAAAKLRADDTTAAPAAKRAKVQMPDEYLPPNNVLFIQNLPEGTTQDDLREVFELHAGLLEIRTIPAKKDIAFVEFADEAAATIAKDALHNFKIDGETKMKVTYARK